MAFKRLDRVEFDNRGETVYGIVERGGKSPKVVVDGRQSYYNVPEQRLRMSSKPVPPEDLKALGLDGSAPQWKAGDRVMFDTRDGTCHGTVVRASGKLKVIQDGGEVEWSVYAGKVLASDAEVRRDEPHEMDRYGVTGFKAYRGMSEETLAMTATVTRDGKAFAHARNGGRGGCNMYYPARGVTQAEVEAFKLAARDWQLSLGMPERFVFDPSDYWLDWKAQKAPYNVTGRDMVERSAARFREWGAKDASMPKP